MGALRSRWEPGYSWHGKAHHSGDTHAAHFGKPLWHKIDRRFISWGAAGWHICFDVLERLLDGAPIGRIAGGDTMKFAGWQRLTAEYAQQFDAETPTGRLNPRKAETLERNTRGIDLS
jgi:hypothetical protein